jgi:hypothetical protein
MVAAGLLHGKVFLYKSEGMKYYTQLECRNHSGKHRAGCRVSSVEFIASSSVVGVAGGAGSRMSTGDARAELAPPLSPGGAVDATEGQQQQVVGNRTTMFNDGSDLLVGTNDSRIRLFKLGDFSLRCKFKGHSVLSLPIRAACSEDGDLVISGSETGSVYIWSKNAVTMDPVGKAEGFVQPTSSASGSAASRSSGTTRNSAYESFENNTWGTTDIQSMQNSPISHQKVSSKLLSERFQLSVPVLTASFGSCTLLENIYSPAQIERMIQLVSSPRNSSPGSKGAADQSSSNFDHPDDITIRMFLRDASRRFVVTADYNGIVRVFIRPLY